MPSAPRSSGGTYARGEGSAPRSYGGGSYGSYARPSGNSYRPAARPASGYRGAESSSPASRAGSDGQWHSFGGGTVNRAAEVPRSEARASVAAGGGWQSFGGNRAASASGVTRSFSGQGSEIWENAPQTRNVVSTSRALSNIRTSSGNAITSNAGLRSNASLSASSRYSGLGARRTFGKGFPHSNSFAPIRSTIRFGYPYRGFGGGCWNCGYGFGLGLGLWPGWGFGFGWPWLDFWNSDLNWNDPYWSWPVYGYDDYAPGYDLYYGTGDYDNNPSYNYDSAPPENYPAIDQNASPEQSAPQTVAPGNSTPPVVVYMKDGSAYSVSQYWVADGQIALHRSLAARKHNGYHPTRSASRRCRM